VRKLLNTLYVTSPDAYLARDGENVLVRQDEQVKFRVPIHNIEGIVSFGYCGASPALMAFCAERGVSLTFLTEHGKFLATVQGPVKGNVLLRRQQYRISDSAEKSIEISRNFILGKVANARTVLQRAVRDHDSVSKDATVIGNIKYLQSQFEKIERCKNLEMLRGIEGDSARTYFDSFNKLILSQKEDFFFHERSRRPPLDNMNALLSFLYTLLTHEVRSALETVGLDPALGFMHQPRPGRPSLALDVMEELRPYLADRLALSLVNRNQITGAGFKRKESGAVIMEDDMRKEVIAAWQKRKQEEITHPFLNEKISIGLLPHVQALLLARFIRGDIDGYPPFIWR
jgi:CRISPR-associated protein Cas1